MREFIIEISMAWKGREGGWCGWANLGKDSENESEREPRQKKKCKRQDVLCECVCVHACVMSVA